MSNDAQTYRLRAPASGREAIADFRSCHTGRFTVGEIVTDFVIRNGRVTRVSIGRVFD